MTAAEKARHRNLEQANRVRIARAEWKRDLRRDRSLILEAIESPPEWLLSARVMDLLLAVPKIIKGTGVSSSTTVGGLTVRQRAMLVRDLQGRVER